MANTPANGLHVEAKRLLLALLFCLACLPSSIAVSKDQPNSGPPAFVANDRIRVEAWIDGGRMHERFLARSGGEWIQIAREAEGGSAGPSALVSAESAISLGEALHVDMDGNALLEEFTAGGIQVLRKVTLCAQGPWVRVTTRLQAPTGAKLHSFVDRFKFSWKPDWSYAPSVGGFAPDEQYKAPLILVQTGRAAFGIVPDLAALDRRTLRKCNHALDLDVPGGPVLSVGFIPAQQAYHTVYEPDPARAWAVGSQCENSYFLLVTAAANPGEAYREAVRLHWMMFGRPTQLSAARQQKGTDTPARSYSWLQKIGPMDQQIADDRRLAGLALWDDWRTEVWKGQSRRRWLLVPLPGGTTGGGVSTLRWGPGPSIYLTAWFNTLRTSYGMALYARRVRDGDLLQRARQSVEVALKAPGRDGSFKCVAVPDPKGGPVLWAAGDGSGDGTQGGYLGYDMSWTAYWLLQWRSAGLPDSGAILPRCRALAKFLCDRQSADGMLPTRFAEDGSVERDLSRTVKAETGPAALFLLELYRQDPDPRWLGAALRGLTFLEEGVIPKRQWYDFETFWSCSPRKPILDSRSDQWPANDLALGQAVAAFLSAYRVTGDRAYLQRGERLLDYLLLFQQCWTNPLVENVAGPETLLGGFTTQNSDSEWSDARQSQFGNVLLDYYRVTGTVEYLERGVAALRAQFPVSPCENYVHSGYGSKPGISSFHWGTGSGMAGVEIEEDYLRDAVVDVAAGTAVGVDGLDVTECSVREGEIRLSFASPFEWLRPPVFAFHQCEPLRRYQIVANGAKLGAWLGADLEKGVPIPLAPPRWLPSGHGP